MNLQIQHCFHEKSIVYCYRAFFPRTQISARRESFPRRTDEEIPSPVFCVQPTTLGSTFRDHVPEKCLVHLPIFSRPSSLHDGKAISFQTSTSQIFPYTSPACPYRELVLLYQVGTRSWQNPSIHKPLPLCSGHEQ